MRHYLNFSIILGTAIVLGMPALAQQDVITTLIGGGPNGIPALQSDLNQPKAIIVDSAGNYYFSTIQQNRTFKVSTSGTLTVVAGMGVSGYYGDGLPGGAGEAQLAFPDGIAVDGSGNIYIADVNNCIVRKVDTTNTITTIAGKPNQCGYGGDGGPAASALLYHPSTLALDGSGNLFIADQANCRIRKLVLTTGVITTYVGTGVTVACNYGGDGGPATSALVNNPTGVAVDTAGNLYFSDTNNYRIRMVTKATGTITTVAGNGTAGYSGDAGPATSAEIRQVYEGVAVNGAGTTVTIADTGNTRIRQFTVGGNITTIGDSTGCIGFSGDTGPALSACFNSPQGVAVTAGGNIFVTDQNNNRVREFTVGGNINTVTGNGSNSTPTLSAGVPPQGVVLNFPYDLLIDPANNIFVNDSNNCLVRELVHSTNLVNFFAGTGVCGDTGSGGAATSAELQKNYATARDSNGNIYIADTLNCIVRMVNNAGIISTFAGVAGHCGYSGDGGPATSANVNQVFGLAVDSQNNLYIADYYNQAIRKVSGGTITTVAGNGIRGFLGDGDPATVGELNDPVGLAFDGAGNLYIAEEGNCIIRELVASTGFLQTVVGIPDLCGFSGDGTAIDHRLSNPDGVASDAFGNLFIADSNNHRLRWVDTNGNMTTFAGTGTAGLYGDGGPATDAYLYTPTGIARDAAGNFLVADYNNLRIREVTAFAALNTSSTNVNFGQVVVKTTSAAQVVTLSALGPLTLGSISITGPFAESDNCGPSLPNETACKVYIVFKPTSSGNQTGTLTILHNGFFDSVSTVSLEGTGTAITVTGGPLPFGSVAVKTTSAAKTITITNKGATSVTMGTITLDESTDFIISANTCPASGSTLAGGAKCTVSVEFHPQATGAKKGALVINDSDPGSPQVVGMTGTGTATVGFTPGSLTFATQAIGTTSVNTKITLTNSTGATLTLGNPALSFTGPFASAKASTCTNGGLIAAGGTCSVFVTLTPTALGYVTGTMSVTDSDASSPQIVALAGTGTGVEFTPNPVSFGTSTVGVQVLSAVTITNTSGAPITFTAATINGTNSADFSTNNTDPPCHGTVAAGAACTFNIYFRPSIVGAESANYVVYDNSPGSPQVLKLSGTGQ